MVSKIWPIPFYNSTECKLKLEIFLHGHGWWIPQLFHLCHKIKIFQTDRNGIKGHFFYFHLFNGPLLDNKGPLAPYSNVMEWTLLFCLQLDGPLSHFTSADRRTDKSKSKYTPVKVGIKKNSLNLIGIVWKK